MPSKWISISPHKASFSDPFTCKLPNSNKAQSEDIGKPLISTVMMSPE